jgi:hypothetical protein
MSVDLIVTGVDLTDEAVLDVVADTLDDCGWSTVDDRTIATVYLTRDADIVAAAVDAAHRIEHALLGAACIRVDEDMVGISDIASRTGVTREAVRTWAHGTRGPGGFPVSRGAIGAGGTRSRVWAWADVVAWLARHYGLCEDEPTLSPRQVAEINGHLQRVDHAIDDAWKQLAQLNVSAAVHIGERQPLDAVFARSSTPRSQVAADEAGFVPVGSCG